MNATIMLLAIYKIHKISNYAPLMFVSRELVTRLAVKHIAVTSFSLHVKVEAFTSGVIQD